MRHRKLLILGLGLVPWGFIASLLGFYYRAWQSLGYLPFYDSDPRENTIALSYQPWITVTAEIWCFSFVIWILVLIYTLTSRKKASRGLIMAGAIGHIMAAILLLSGIQGLFHE
jgi:hypothetical protein